MVLVVRVETVCAERIPFLDEMLVVLDTTIGLIDVVAAARSSTGRAPDAADVTGRS